MFSLCFCQCMSGRMESAAIRLMLGAFLNLSTMIFWGTVFHWTSSSLIGLAISKHQGSTCPHFPSSGIKSTYTTVPVFLSYGPKGWNSGPYACYLLSPQPFTQNFPSSRITTSIVDQLLHLSSFAGPVPPILHPLELWHGIHLVWYNMELAPVIGMQRHIWASLWVPHEDA